MNPPPLVAWLLLLVVMIPASNLAAQDQSPDDTAIAEEAFVYGFPIVMNYGTLYEYFIDTTSDQYKCSFNEIYNTARVYTPADTSVVTPNSDTPYSFFCADLRAEPIVFAVPKIEKERYFSVQLVDLYTFNFGYVGSRATGNDGGKYMIAGPNWTGEKPAGIDKVFHCETDFATAIIRTQLFDPADIENVKQVQKGYQILPLSTYLGEKAPAVPPAIKWPKIDKELAAKDPFAYLAFLLNLCPPVGPAESEIAMRARFAKIGIETGKSFPCCELTTEQETAIKKGAEQGFAAIKKNTDSLGDTINGWHIFDVENNREACDGNWLLRASIAMAGIYANDSAEATYPITRTDANGQPLDGSQQKYTITFPAGQLPPVNAFWSVTMYNGKTQLLIKNPINRYLINSPMLPNMKKNADGSLTIYIQKDSPGADKEANWLPAPDGPIYLAMRLYWPKTDPPSILPPGHGTWQPPGVVRAD
ncbi:DUF1254 domain-containing protein [Bremerella cremea]|uniref:DUF1254 domain-containing protein n=1 Tax=Bremerella cremea TaxID=1031537 RepID=A0A368KJ43_9BACT|nr:DUF1254 domain-containing protein [Bremerella cremea]RCS40574.1 DUF1254 domain-containing protein [Bremerella cremea]